MIFVAVGTHHQPFDRLLRAADRAAAELGEPLVAQRGPSRIPLTGEATDRLSPARFEALLTQARVVVLHAGSASFLQARALGRRPILVPRRPEHGEHIDDHQLRFARSIPEAEAAVAEPEGLLAAIRIHREDRASAGPAQNERFCAAFAGLVEQLLRDA